MACVGAAEKRELRPRVGPVDDVQHAIGEHGQQQGHQRAPHEADVAAADHGTSTSSRGGVTATTAAGVATSAVQTAPRG